MDRGSPHGTARQLSFVELVLSGAGLCGCCQSAASVAPRYPQLQTLEV
jgi:hypothetical protein